MRNELANKRILIVSGSLLSTGDLHECLEQAGARVTTVTNIISAFTLLERVRFDAAIIDHGLHNAAYDLCTELQAYDVPYIFSTAPHKLETRRERHAAAERVVARLTNKIEQDPKLTIVRGIGRSGPSDNSSHV